MNPREDKQGEAFLQVIGLIESIKADHYGQPLIAALHLCNDLADALTRSSAAPAVPFGWVAVPEFLTAEEGFKAMLSAEFPVECYEGSGNEPHMVPWDTIKLIHKAVVQHAKRIRAAVPECAPRK